MSTSYKAVLWNRSKYIYDGVLIVAVALFIWIFTQMASPAGEYVDPRAVQIRAFGAAAFVLLHIILSIGPLARLNPRFLPLLYNRRHMGVTMFVVALLHARYVLQWYHDLGNVDPLVSLFISNTRFDSLAHFPFEMLGVGALLIFLFMAVTSHDFWLANLTAPVWKAIHMGVYLAYALLVGHVMLGALQSNQSPVLFFLVTSGGIWIVSIHLLAAHGERATDNQVLEANDGWVDIGSFLEIPDQRAKIVSIAGERVAVFRYGDKVSAVSNVCQHQNGPLGEGRIIDGLITCPWHGFQYRPESGASPPPFTEQIPTFPLCLSGDRVLVSTKPNPPGTHVEPARIESGGPNE